MNRMISLVLVLVLCLSLCACGGGTSNNTAADEQNAVVSTSEQIPEVTDSVKDTALGQEMELGFATMKFSSAALTYSVGGDGFSVNAQEGMRLFSLVGTIENTGGNPLPVSNICAEIIFNGEYTYLAKATILNSRSFPVSVAPLANAEYWIYAEIPDALLEKLVDCVVCFSLNEDFASVPDSTDSGDYTFRIPLDESVCKATLEAMDTATEFFAECPILPTPVNYTPVYQSSSSSSSFNGKVSSIKYSFSVVASRSDDMMELYSTYIGKLQKAGFTIQNDSGSGCDIYSDGVKLASVWVEGGRMQFDIVPGNENLAAPSGSAPEAEAVPSGDTVVNVGDTIETEYISMTLEKYGSDMEIRSGTSQYGTYTYYSSDNGDPYFYVYGALKNLGGNPVDIRNIYVQFCFDGKYNYKGSVDGVSEDSNRFINDVSPLSSVNYYMYAAVPQELLDSFTTCTVRIGFTENFDYKVVDVNDLPKFENCDDVFVLEITA